MMAKNALRWAPACMLPMLLVACDAAGEAQPTTASAATDAAPAAPEAVDALPLRRGFYVRSDDTCAAPSNATLGLVRRDGITSCDFTAIERIGESRYRAREACTERGFQRGERYEVVNEYEVLAEDRYRVTYEYGETVEFGFCPQQSLPEPWRSNDISDLID
jgi:nucleoid-associated protein YgaU